MKKVDFLIITILMTMSLILVFYSGTYAETKLRNSPQKLKSQDIKAAVEKCNFFDKELNDNGDFPNDFVDNGDGTVTDRATGLMWEQKGSKREKSFRSATKYVKKLNKKKLAGHDDWRIPTIEELYSLLEPNKSEQLYINPVFGAKPYHCWSIDESGLSTQAELERRRYITLDYKSGTVSDAFTGMQPGGASFTNFSSYIRAVRSIR